MADEEDYFHRLVELMDILRGPKGCPWDREQTRETLKPMLMEEAYEVLSELDGSDPDALCEELGDLLFQVIFHSRISKENGEFNAYDVCRRNYEKMVRRHPHVFGTASYEDSRQLLKDWENIKTAEKRLSGRKDSRKSLLDGIPGNLPALYVAYQISSKAARIGFDWPHIEGIRDQLLEEFQELKEALQSRRDERVKEEVGDLLFTALNIARFLQIDPETALKRANRKFSERFREMEGHFARQGRQLKEVCVDEMETVWKQQKSKNKTRERKTSGKHEKGKRGKRAGRI